MDRDEVLALLRSVAAGETAPADAVDNLSLAPLADLGFASVDHNRELRDGFPEVVFGPGKTPDQTARIALEIYQRSGRVVVTRVVAEQADAVAGAIPNSRYDEGSRIVWADRKPKPRTGHVAVITAGTSDIPVAEEAALTADLSGACVSRHYDIGVAGLHRIGPHLEELRRANVAVVVAGMDGALPSVVGGLLRNPVIAVPTSVGYGASLGGIAALLTMLNSCAAGVSVVNIDNGFGAGYIAASINRLAVESATDD